MDLACGTLSPRTAGAGHPATVPQDLGRARVRLTRLENGKPAHSAVWTLDELLAGQSFAAETSRWSITARCTPSDDGAVIRIRAERLSGVHLGEWTLCLELELAPWSQSNYVLFPAAAYDGNRFESWSSPYPPTFEHPRDAGPLTPPVVADIPRLSAARSQPSHLQQLAGDLAMPAMGLLLRGIGKGILLLAPPATPVGSTGFALEESADRCLAWARVITPGVRLGSRYHGFKMKPGSPDRGALVRVGGAVDLTVRLVVIDATMPAELMEALFDHRHAPVRPASHPPVFPLSAAFDLIAAKHDAENWCPQQCCYRVGRGDSAFTSWQTGWVGGLISTLPMLTDGSAAARERAFETFDFVFPRLQAHTGLLRAMEDKGRILGDHFQRLDDPSFVLVRRCADALYYGLRQLPLLHAQRPDPARLDRWEAGLKRLAGGMASLWERHGQFGQFVNVDRGEIAVGGSAAAALAPAGLALAADVFKESRYLRLAEQSGRALYETFARRGFTNGGPSEILSAPDSESGFALLESLVVLYEKTLDRAWLQAAQQVAAYCATWVASFDYDFPDTSTFGRLGIRSHGAVFANVQNKHGSPGICTMSGTALLRLFRATRDRRYLALLRDIVRALPQCVSRPDRPVHAPDGRALPAGWVNERINTSDWLEPVGEVFFQTCWPEVSVMLSYAEIPGVYVLPDTRELIVFDHVEAELSPDGLSLRLINPTPFPARVKLLCEGEADLSRPLGPGFLWRMAQVVDVPPGGDVIDVPIPTP